MANANIFLPLFDPAIDTFNAIRQHSTFCFTVILAIALRADYVYGKKSARCFSEAQNLATKTQFASSARLETVQGMLLLAAHTERNWFAVSHAYQMSQDIGLPNLLSREFEMSDSEAGTLSFNDRRLIEQIRTALVLHQVEQEITSGIARKSKHCPVNNLFLRNLLQNEYSTAYDVRIVANVEVVQLRG